MTTRADQKRESRARILEVASRSLREQGLTGAAIAAVMQEAGLTHGAFYSHFANKDQLAQDAFHYALDTGQPRWFENGKQDDESWSTRLNRLAASYLSPKHRDDRANGCAIATLVSEVATATDTFKQAYGERVETTLRAICDDEDPIDDGRLEDAIVFLALCVGGLNLSRTIDDPRRSSQILAACRRGIDRLTGNRQQ